MAETNQTQREEELARREALLAQREAQLEKEQAELAAAKAQSAERKKTLLDNNDPNFVNPKEKLYDKFPLTVHQMDIDRKSTRLNSSHRLESRMPSSA